MDMADFIPLAAKLTGGEGKKSTASPTTAQNTKFNCPPFLQEIIMISSTFKTAPDIVTECKLSVYLSPDLELSLS